MFKSLVSEIILTYFSWQCVDLLKITQISKPLFNNLYIENNDINLTDIGEDFNLKMLLKHLAKYIVKKS